MKIYFVSFLSIVFFSNLFAQSDTIYFDSNWEKTTKENAEFYRPQPKKTENGLFHIKDYFINNHLQMDALATDADGNEIVEGTWFYKNGNKKYATKILSKVDRLEEQATYFPDGKLQAQGITKNGTQMQGTFPINEKTFKSVEFTDFYRVANYSFYNDTISIAEVKEIAYSKDTLIATFYNRKGKLISSYTYKRPAEYNSTLRLIPFQGIRTEYSINRDNFILDSIGYSKFTPGKGKILVETFLKGNKELKGSYSLLGKDLEGDIYFHQKGEIVSYINGVKDGKVKCCANKSWIDIEGNFKNGQEYNGQFYYSNSSNEEIKTYKNGELEGPQITFDLKGNIRMKETLKNGVPDGEKIMFNNSIERPLKSIYKNGEPWEGEVSYSIYSDEVIGYKNGKKVKETFYNHNTKKLAEIRYFSDSIENEITKEEFFKDGKKYMLNYKDGLPFNGVKVSGSYFWYTYKEGEATGPYEIKTEDYNEKGNYKNLKKQGEIQTTYKGKKYSAVFDNGEIISGEYFSDTLLALFTYKNAQKEGPFFQFEKTFFLPYDSAQGQYINDKPLGTFHYYFKKKQIAKGEYKNGKPFNGEFYNSHKFEKYEDGNLIQKTEYSSLGLNKTTQWFRDNKIIKESYQDISDSLIHYTCFFKNGKPWEGKLLKKTGKYDRDDQITAYKDGQKNGEEIIKNSYGNLFRKFNYKNNKLEGVQTFIAKDKKEYKATYKNNQAIDGEVVNLIDNSVLKITRYNNSLKIKEVLIPNVDDANRIKDSLVCNFKNNSFYQGKCFQNINKIELVQEYEKGILKKSSVKPSWGSWQYYDELRAEYQVLHFPKQDSTIFGNGKIVVFNYSNRSKTSGTAHYYNQNELLGEIKFENDSVTFADFNLNGKYSPRTYYYITKPDGQFISGVNFNREDIKDLSAELQIPNRFKGPAYLYLSDLDESLQHQKVKKIQYYYKGKPVPKLKFTLKDNKAQEGSRLLIRYDNKEEFEVETYKNGEKIKTEKYPINYLDQWITEKPIKNKN